MPVLQHRLTRFVVLITLFVCAFLGLMLFRHGRGSEKDPIARPLPERRTSSGVVQTDATSHKPVEVEQIVRPLLAEHLGHLPAESRDQLADAIVRAVAIYQDDTPASYIAFKRATEQPIDPELLNEQEGKMRWRQRCAALQGSQLNLTDISLSEPTANGKAYVPPAPAKGSQAFSGMPYGCNPDKPLPGQTGRHVVRITIPTAQLKCYDGAPFNGRLVVTLSWDATLRKWLLISTSIVDVPMSSGVYVPPT
jgi:hypothetical protein